MRLPLLLPSRLCPAAARVTRALPRAATCACACARAATTTVRAPRTSYVCGDCGADAPKWSGRCPACAAWNTMKAFSPPPSHPGGGDRHAHASPASFARFGAGPPKRDWGLAGEGGDDAGGRLVALSRVGGGAHERVSFGSPELDRVFGGGLVRGSISLLGGPPGSGKSTLLLQMGAMLAGARLMGDAGGAGALYADVFRGRRGGGSRGLPSPPAPPPRRPVVAYVSGEESSAQLKGRAARLGLGSTDCLHVLNETRLEVVLEQLDAAAAALAAGAEAGGDGAGGAALAAVIVDSIQAVYTESLPSAAGSVAQVRECALRLAQFAKATGIPVLLVGHVTKAGDLAGPRVLEHLVDVVLYIDRTGGSSSGGGGAGDGREGDSDGDAAHAGGDAASSAAATAAAATSGGGLRLIRAIKNRFAAAETAILSLGRGGFSEADPARLFLSRLPRGGGGGVGSDDDGGADGGGGGGASDPAGVCVTVTVEGSRPLAVEVQALTMPPVGAYPRHRCVGVPLDRLHALLAVLARHTRLRPAPHAHDVLIAVVGGLRLADPSADLAVAVAVASSLLGRAAPRDAVFLGEVSLSGGVHAGDGAGGGWDARLQTAARLGFSRAFVPAGVAPPPGPPGGAAGDGGVGGPRPLQLVRVRTLAEALARVFGPAAAAARGGGGGRAARRPTADASLQQLADAAGDDDAVGADSDVYTVALGRDRGRSGVPWRRGVAVSHG